MKIMDEDVDDIVAVYETYGPEAAKEALSEPECPYCGRVMTWREKWEQGACNDCYSGSNPSDGPEGQKR